ncbi:MAG: efflux RND transporter periplasmic adaptor subunit [Burkholderiales bacterium]|nr:efflux RND transporter periplasmic adaptor subunit [Burkholderiales bacterium]|tara:strand:+ start:25444 stop:26442 length:999 start_codon:yes stop_codon:yes gene_type:complete
MLLSLLFGIGPGKAAYADTVKASIIELSEIAIYPSRSAFASVITLNNSKLSAEVPAKIKSITAEVGQVVNKGDILIQLDSTDYNLALQQASANLIAAQSNLELSKKQLERAEKLVSDGFISSERLNLRETEFTNAKSDAALRRAQYNVAKRNVAKCSIKAPFKSVIRERIGQVGEITTPGSPLLHLSDLSTVEIDAKIQPRDIESLTLSSVIIFTSSGIDFPVTIKRIVPVVNEENRNQTVRLKFIKSQPSIGSAGTITWTTDQPHAPTDLIVQRNDQLGVFIFEQEKAKFFVLSNALEGSPAAINLPADTLVIYQGQHRLQDGEFVSTASD